MAVVVSPSQLDVEPVLLSRASCELVFELVKEAWIRDGPLEVGVEHDVSTARVHLVRLSRVNRLLLDAFNLKRVLFYIKDLA